MINKPGPIARRAVADAIANIGISEIGPPYENRGTAIDHYNIAAGNSLGDPWCAAFVFVRQTVAASDLKTPLPADFPGPDNADFPAGAAVSWAAWAKKHGRWIPADSGVHPLKGDLCCFDIVSEGGIHHIGTVVEDGTADGFVTVEGNTHTEGAVSRDGYCVARRDRTYANLGPGGGFVRLPG